MKRTRTLLPFASLVAVAMLAAACATPPATPADASATGGDGAPKALAPAPAPRPIAPPPASPPSPVLTLSQQALAAGVKSYEDGDYKNALAQLQAAVNFGLPSPAQTASAHKYLAFINCVQSRARACRDEFRKAFAVDPAFDLAPAEAGHPTWGPVFRAAKVEHSKKPAK